MGAGHAAEVHGAQGGLLLRGEGLQHLQLDRQPMGVPPRDELRPPALERVVLVDDVLQDLDSKETAIGSTYLPPCY